MIEATSDFALSAELRRPLYSPMDGSCCSACVEAESACDHVRRPGSAVPIRTGIKRVSHPEEKRGGNPLPPLLRSDHHQFVDGLGEIGWCPAE